PTSPLPSPQFRMEIDFASNLVAEATLWECDFLSHHNFRYWKTTIFINTKGRKVYRFYKIF
ncbi:hypothetical protein PDN13_25710, partial [Bacillus cereus]|nr:hypothetical protein [Bacillus cereus]MDA2129624.1 hypothetical protein [Bacillus cereus]